MSKRMFDTEVLYTDAFMDMSAEARCLYTMLSLSADDYGFVGSPKSVMRMSNIAEKFLNELDNSNFIIKFSSGIIAITHWNINNSLRNDRVKETKYLAEKKLLGTDESGLYYLLSADCGETVSNCGQMSADCGEMSAQDNIKEDNISECNKKEINKEKNPPQKKYGEYQNVLLSDDDIEKLKEEFPYDYQQRIEKLSEYIASCGKKYKNHLATIRNWARRDKEEKSISYEASYDLDEYERMLLTRPLKYDKSDKG